MTAARASRCDADRPWGRSCWATSGRQGAGVAPALHLDHAGPRLPLACNARRPAPGPRCRSPCPARPRDTRWHPAGPAPAAGPWRSSAPRPAGDRPCRAPARARPRAPSGAATPRPQPQQPLRVERAGSVHEPTPGLGVGAELVGGTVVAQIAGILVVAVREGAERSVRHPNGTSRHPARIVRHLARERDDAVDAAPDGAVAADAGQALLVGLRSQAAVGGLDEALQAPALAVGDAALDVAEEALRLVRDCRPPPSDLLLRLLHQRGVAAPAESCGHSAAPSAALRRLTVPSAATSR